MKGVNQVDLELAKAAKQQKSVERSIEEREQEKMLAEATTGAAKSGDDVAVMDGAKLPEQKEILAQQKRAAKSQRLHEKEAEKHAEEAEKLKPAAQRAKASYEKLKGLEGEVNPKSEKKLKAVTEAAEKTMLAAESKVNQLQGKSQDAANAALEMKKLVDKDQLDLLAKKKDDKYKQEISDAANGKSPGTDGKPAKADADAKDAQKDQSKKLEVKKEEAKEK